MKKILLFIAFTILASLGNIYPQDTNGELRVLCYNIHHCNPPSKKGVIDMAAIAKVINNAKPDLVALQEVDVNTDRSGKGINQAEELGRLTGMYSFFVKTIDFEGGEYGIAILSKYPILHKTGIELPEEHNAAGETRALASVTIEPVTGKKIVFTCTHLDLKEENKELQINAITDYVRNTDIPFIIAGDFNSKPGSYVVNELDKVFQRTCTDCPFTIPEVKPNRTIDYIAFYPKDAFTILEHTVIKEPYASDHLPVFSRLKLK